MRSPEVATSSRDEWKSYWPVVLACALGFAFASTMAPAAGVFMDPLGREFDWSVTLQSSGMPVAAAVGVLLSPFAGHLFDRFGVRRLALPGLVFNGLCIAAFGLANGSPLQWFGLWILYGFSALVISSTAWTAVISNTFDKGLGLAIGLTLTGTAVAQIIIPPMANALIESFGWRYAYMAIGLGGSAIAFVACVFFLRDGSPRLMRERAASSLPGLSVREAWRSAAIRRIGVAAFLMMLISIALNVHQFKILTEAGVSRSDAAFYAALVGAAGIAGKLTTGWLLDRFPVARVGGLTLCSTAIAFSILMIEHPHPALIVTAMLVNGYGSGSKLQIVGLMTSRYAGLRNFGAIFGIMTTLIAAGSGIGPVVAGMIRDAYGDYTPFMIVGIVGSLLSGLLLFGLPAYPNWGEPTGQPGGVAPE